MNLPLPFLLCQGKHLILRRFIPDDGAITYAISQEESTKRELPDEVFDSLEETMEIMEELNANADCGQYPIVYCIALAGDNKPIGHVSLSPIGDNAIEIGYAVGEKWRGNGYGSEATSLLTQWALKVGGFSKLYGIVKESNPASIRCLEKAGYRLIAKEKRDCFGGKHLIREYVREAD